MKSALPLYVLLAVLGLASGFAGAIEVETGPAAPGAATLSAQALPAGPAPVLVTLRAVTLTATAGVPTEVDVETWIGPGVQLNGPQVPQPWGDWVVTDIRSGAFAARDGGRVRTDRMTLLTYAEGQVAVPGLRLQFRTPDGRSGTFQGVPLVLTVRPSASAALRDLKAPVGFFPWWWVVIAVLAVGALAAIGIWYAQRRRWLGPLLPPPPPVPPEVTARQRLEALRASGKLAAGEFKAYYSELSEILRRYLEARFAVVALDRTTQELMRELKRAEVARPDQAAAREVLEHADLAKFAKFRPESQEAEHDWQQVGDVVVRTTPAAPAPEAKA
jgi:hypothetical protein